MEFQRTPRRITSVFSKKIKAGKRRTYYIDVLQTKSDDYYLALTEHARRLHDDGFERHKIFLYKEDFNRFVAGLQEVIDHVKTELMPDYDYDEFTRRYEEQDETPETEEKQEKTQKLDDDDDLTW